MAKIGIDVTSAITQGGGIGRYTRELTRALTALPTSHTYQLFSAKPPATLPVANPLPTGQNITYKPAKLDESWLYRIWYRAKFPLPIQTFTGKIDLFHSPDFVLPPVMGKIPTLLTVHDLSFMHFPEAYVPQLVSYLNSVVPWSINRASHILADSVATKNDLINMLHVNPDKVTVLYCGVNEMFRPITEPTQLETVRKKYQLGDTPYLLSVGTVQPRKNYQMLIRAFAKIKDQIPHTLAIAGGKGWLYEEIIKEIETLGITDRVKFLGFVDDEDLPTLYSGASIYLFPTYYEGFGLPILEAMATGTPVISSNASCLPEVVGNAGELIDPYDEDAWATQMVTLLQNDGRRTHLIEQGFTQTKRFQWDLSAQQLVGVYEGLLNR